MAHKPFNLYKRPIKKPGKYIYYCMFYDEVGNRMTAQSTGQISKAAAETWAHEQLKKGIITTNKNISFEQYAQDWWLWDKCQYVKGRLARGANISRDYVDSMRTYLERHILPYFKNKKLQKITSRMIESWVMSLKEKTGRTGNPLSHITINHCLTPLSAGLRLDFRPQFRRSLSAKGRSARLLLLLQL